MSEYYTHLLISLPKDFTPSPQQVQAFLTGVVEHGHVPTPVKTSALRFTGKTSTVPNPFGGKPLVIERPEALPITSLEEAARQIGANSDYRLGIEGIGKPDHPPLSIGHPEGFDGDYSLIVSCRVSNVLRATSSHDEENGEDDQSPRFGSPCSREFSLGKFQNPWNGQVIEVAGAGCARFWIEVQLGKFMVPPIADDHLEIIDAAFMALAKRTFGIDFVQGCSYG